MNHLTFNRPVVYCCKRRVQRCPNEEQPIGNNKEVWGNIGKFLFNDHSEVQYSSAQRVSGAYDRFKDPIFHGTVWDDILSGIALQDDQEYIVPKKVGLNSYRPVGVTYYIGNNKDFKNHQNNFQPYYHWFLSGLRMHEDPNIVVATRDPSGKIELMYMGLKIDIIELNSFEKFEQIINSGSFLLRRSTDGKIINFEIDPAYIDHILLYCGAVKDELQWPGISNISPTDESVEFLLKFYKPSEYSCLSRGKEKTS